MSSAGAGEVEILIDKLVEKGVLSPMEAEQLLQDVEQEALKEYKATLESLADDIGEAEGIAVPKWAAKMKVKGDLRLRYQGEHRSPARHRGRFRLRVGVESEVTDKVKVGFGIASGGSDPRSTNQTFDNEFQTPDLRIDYAYAQYTPYEWLKVVGGKFKNPLWKPTDLLWDSDINPEGVAFQIYCDRIENLHFFFNQGTFIVDEINPATDDPVMWVFQPGVDWKITDGINWKTAGTYYLFNNPRNISGGTSNTFDGGDVLFDFNVISAATELGFANPFNIPGLHYLGLFGEYVYNPDPRRHNDGFAAGLKFGDKKVKKKGQWQAKALYRQLERDAWLDPFPDSDALGGITGLDGYEVIFNYGIADNVIVGVDYYHSVNTVGDRNPQDLWQFDIIFKF
jgi:hypothetical protein